VRWACVTATTEIDQAQRPLCTSLGNRAQDNRDRLRSWFDDAGKGMSAVCSTRGVVRTMPRRRFNEQQINEALQQVRAGGERVRDVIRRLGISEQTFYRWKKRFAEPQPFDPRRMRLLEEENHRLKQLVGELTLEKRKLEDMLGRRSARSA
jgi:putative transposase